MSLSDNSELCKKTSNVLVPLRAPLFWNPEIGLLEGPWRPSHPQCLND